MHCRIVLELVHNKPYYLDACLQGMNQASLQMIASLSDEYSNDYNAQGTQKKFEAETLAVTKKVSFMGLWQILAAAELFCCPLQIYPARGHNLVITPPLIVEGRPAIHLMWSSSRDLRAEHWAANHILPVLPMSQEPPREEPSPPSPHEEPSPSSP